MAELGQGLGKVSNLGDLGLEKFGFKSSDSEPFGGNLKPFEVILIGSVSDRRPINGVCRLSD